MKSALLWILLPAAALAAVACVVATFLDLGAERTGLLTSSAVGRNNQPGNLIALLTRKESP